MHDDDTETLDIGAIPELDLDRFHRWAGRDDRRWNGRRYEDEVGRRVRLGAPPARWDERVRAMEDANDR